MSKYLVRLWHDQDGLTSVEYALLLAVLSLAAAAAFGNLHNDVVKPMVADGSARMDEAAGMGCEH